MGNNFSGSKHLAQATANITSANLSAMDIGEARQSALRLLLDEDIGPERGKKLRLAKRIGKSAAQVSQWLSGYRSIEEGTAREIEARAGKEPRWMDEVCSPSAPRTYGLSSAIDGLMQAGKPPSIIAMLQGYLREHNATRRRVIGGLLADLAASPDNHEVAAELATLLDGAAKHQPRADA